MMLSSNCVKWEDNQSSVFDAWLHLSSIGNKINFRIPIKSHKHARQFDGWERASSFIFHRNGMVSVSYETETGEKKLEGKNLGIDLGLNKLFACSDNTLSFRSVPAYYTSITCRKCGHRDKKNRLSQEQFCCSECDHSEHADIHASKNILERFVLGPYGAEFKTTI